MHFKNIMMAATMLASMGMMAATCYAEEPAAPLDEKKIEDLVKKAIQNNPELIIKSLQDYQIKKRADEILKAAQNLRSAETDLKNNPNSPVAGNPKGDVTIVQFFDYHCGYCKRFFATLKQLMDEDKNVKIVFKEFPILSEDSRLASKAALAVNSIDKSKYIAFHALLMKNSGEFTRENLKAKAREVGIDEATFSKAMENPELEKELENNRKLAESLNISGTPGVIIGQEIAPGAIPLEELKLRVANARISGKDKEQHKEPKP